MDTPAVRRRVSSETPTVGRKTSSHSSGSGSGAYDFDRLVLSDAYSQDLHAGLAVEFSGFGAMTKFLRALNRESVTGFFYETEWRAGIAVQYGAVDMTYGVYYFDRSGLHFMPGIERPPIKITGINVRYCRARPHKVPTADMR